MVDLTSGGFFRNVVNMQRRGAPADDGFTDLADRSSSRQNGPEAADSGPISSLMSRLQAAYPDELRNKPASMNAGKLAHLSRCAVLQAIGAAFVVGLWIAGIAGKPFETESAFLCWLIVGVGAIGVTCLFLQRWRDVEWIAVHVVRIGLLGTVVGLIIAFSAAKSGGTSNPDEVRTMIGAVVDGMYVSLYATLLGIATNLWLKINLRLLGPDHG